MIIDEEVEVPMEIPIKRKSVVNNKKFVIVQNHVREISPKSNECNVNSGLNTCHSSKDIPHKFHKKKSRKIKKTVLSKKSSTESGDSTNEIPEISQSDIEELKAMYYKCKSVIKKMETKYGHILNCNSDTNSGPSKRAVDEPVEECNCLKNQKIIFNDNGEQEIVETNSEDHICPKKLKRIHVETSLPNNIEIQYSENDIQLPDDMESLTTMLKNPNIEISYRNKIIYKVRSLKQEFLNEIRFNKHSLIEKLKSNPDEMLDFKGSNLASLPGYS